MSDFKEYVNKRTREAKKELTIIEKILRSADFKVKNFTDQVSPYIFVYSNNDVLSFDGIRIYKIGNDIAFRIQREAETQPYGSAYTIPVVDMFRDRLASKMNEKDAGQHVIQEIIEEIKHFFTKTAHAEKDIRASLINRERDSLGRVIIKTTGTDYSNMLFNKAAY